jgi:beta-lactam-binding protein with PASTA domain
MVQPAQLQMSRVKRKLLIGSVIAAFLIAFVGYPTAILTGLWLSERQKRAERAPQVRVPNVVGQDYRAAEATLKGKGLGMRVLARRSDQNQPADIILDQVPRRDESVDVGYTIGVTIGDIKPEGPVSPQR